MKRLLFIWLTGTILSANAQSETTVRLITLAEAIRLARMQSVDALVALNELKTAYWEYRTYRANLLPEVNFDSTIPSYHKNYDAYQQENGDYKYLRNDYMQLKGNLSIDQHIWLTGGTLSLNTSLDYLKLFGGKKAESYMSIPVAVRLDQPIFGVNTVKWNRRIEPVRYKEAKAAFLSATEKVTMATITGFFDLLLAKEKVIICKQNLTNAEKLYEIAKVKREMGQISENDLLQLQLNVLTAKSTLTDNESNLKSHMFKLRSFLAIGEGEELEPVLPEAIPDVMLSYDEVLNKALANNSFALNIRRRQMEADYEVAKAKGNRRQMTLYAQVGLTGTDRSLADAYRGLKSNRVVEVGVKIPILDWGKKKGSVKMAESNRQVIQSKLQQETMNFSQNLFILVERYNNQRIQLDIADLSDHIAKKRYDTNVKTFLIGKISTLDLNDSQIKKDEARQQHITQLFYYWYYYYQLRSLTLWDFERRTDIEVDFEKIIRG